MARIRKFVAYRRLERPYTRVSKFRTQNFVRARPGGKVTRFQVGSQVDSFDTVVRLVSQLSENIRTNALESARVTCNKLLETKIPKGYYLRVLIYPHHILRENPLAAGAGADRMSTGMQKAFGKPLGTAARVKAGQAVMEVRVNKENISLAKEALQRATKKLPKSFRLVSQSL